MITVERDTTLCVKCAKACMGSMGGCSWSEDLTPVNGWDAIIVHDEETGKLISCQVLSCPEFVRGIYRPLMQTEGVVRLLEAAFTLARKDYIADCDRQACMLFVKKFMPDADDAVRELKNEAKKHDDMLKKRGYEL